MVLQEKTNKQKTVFCLYIFIRPHKSELLAGLSTYESAWTQHFKMLQTDQHVSYM